MTKEEKLKPHLIECIDRMKKLIEIDAPGVIVGSAAFSILATTLAVYGESAGSTLIGHLRDQNLHSRGICTHADCTKPIDRPNVDVCQDCQKELGFDDASLDALFAEEEQAEHRYPCPTSGPGSNCGECSRCIEQDRRAMDGE